MEGMESAEPRRRGPKEATMLTRTNLVLVAAVVFSLSVSAGAVGRATLTLENASAEDALVRVVGPTTTYVETPNSSSRTIRVDGGTYRLYVRYGQPGHYSYTRGEPFAIKDDGREWEEVTVTLHKVPNGNYRTSPSDAAEFNGAR